MAAKKERLDIRLVREGLCDSREKAKALIMSGNVYVGEAREDKAGTMVPEDKPIRIRENPLRYVSRGGLKLEKAISRFSLQMENKVCIDAGASTGGFTDCMLQNGAKRVYAIDVGYGQLAWSLRSDERVVVLEKTNVRFLTEEQVPELCDFASADLSFISLTKVWIPLQQGLLQNGQMVCLVKPQFEAGRENVGKKGVVRDAAVHEEVLLRDHGLGFSARVFDFRPDILPGSRTGGKHRVPAVSRKGRQFRFTGPDRRHPGGRKVIS